MLVIEVPEREWYDEETSEFVMAKKDTLQLEHSLVSLSKWESKWCKPFLSKDRKSDDEVIDYIRCMTITQNVNPKVYLNLPGDVLDQINDYINAPMTATWFSKTQNAKHNKEVITSEVIYYWMVAHGIPFECQKWHINRLLTLVRVCNEKNAPKKKQNRLDALRDRAALNQARKEQYNTKG